MKPGKAHPLYLQKGVEIAQAKDDLLLDAPAPVAAPTKKEAEDKPKSASEAHAALFTENKFPSATTCGTCHPRHFEEWSVSQHSYAQLSPVYMAFQNFINAQVNGTNGDFCIRCHNQVGMAQGESPQISNLERHPTSREGITCVVATASSSPLTKQAVVSRLFKATCCSLSLVPPVTPN
ncbi:MAG: multiheme c-type cytochrome [Proteobacteria bacterium]|nr:multiheme c-type cytochrome [Pseudomonadota bacterium]